MDRITSLIGVCRVAKICNRASWEGKYHARAFVGQVAVDSCSLLPRQRQGTFPTSCHASKSLPALQ